MYARTVTNAWAANSGLVANNGEALFTGTGDFEGDLTVRAGDASAFVVSDTSNNVAFKVNDGGGTTDNYVQIGLAVGSTTPMLFDVNKGTAADPSGANETNGAIYYNTGGAGGAAGTSASEGKFRCYEGNKWKNCIGMRDIAERRWGYASIPGSSSVTQFNVDGDMTLGAVQAAGTASNQVESNYINYATGTSSGNTNGIASGTTAASCLNGNTTQCPTATQGPAVTQTRWLPKLVTRVRVDSSAVTSTRDWITLSSASETGSDGTGQYIGVRYSTNVGGETAWQCASSDGTTPSVTTTGVTVTANHVYDIIVDLSTSGTLVCSVADDGTTGAQAAFTTVSKATNLPATSTGLAIEESVTTLTTAARNLAVSYVYLENQ